MSFVITDEDTDSDQEETEKTAQVREYSQWILSVDTLSGYSQWILSEDTLRGHSLLCNAFTKISVICVGEWLDVVRKYSW